MTVAIISNVVQKYNTTHNHSQFTTYRCHQRIYNHTHTLTHRLPSILPGGPGLAGAPLTLHVYLF